MTTPPKTKTPGEVALEEFQAMDELGCGDAELWESTATAVIKDFRYRAIARAEQLGSEDMWTDSIALYMVRAFDELTPK